jgi:predicted phage baseplate assembly protein
VGGDRITLARMYDGLEPGRLIAVAGERTDVPDTPGIHATELATVSGIEQAVDPLRPGDPVRPTLLLAAPLSYTYRRDTLTVLGNVVSATQGETRSEVLGSGDAAQSGQTFPLRQVTATAPLTRLPSVEADGEAPELTVRVDGVAWTAADEPVDLGPTDAGYVLVDRPDGTVAVAFGDGRHGARPATGIENITARYRIGAGPSGNVAEGQITQLATHPLGVTAVTNPVPATGGARADNPDELRAGIPRRTLALDRLVSVPDHEAFALARAGIGKVSARRLFDGDNDVVHLTVAGVDDAPVDPSDALLTTLRTALGAAGDPHLPITVAVRDLVTLVLSAGVKVAPGYAFELVEPAVRATALRVLGFGERALGAPVYLSAVVAALGAVPGVDYLDVDVFAGIPATGDPIALVTAAAALTTANPVVPAAEARYERVVHTVTTTDGLGTLSLIALRYGVGLTELARLNPGLAGVTLDEGARVVVFRGIRPAQLAVLPPDIPAALTLRRIP